MSAWRRKANALFPELQPLSTGWSSAYDVFLDLLPFTLQAHQRKDDDALRRAYGFAEWCLHQKPKELWNAAGTCFYEHLFDDPKLSKEVIPWLSTFVIENCADLWKDKISVSEIQNLRKSLPSDIAKLKRNVYQSGEIESL